MKTPLINALVLFVLPLTVANALTLYEDPATGQVFTTAGEGRVKIDSFPGTEEADASSVTEPAGSSSVEDATGASADADVSVENVVAAVVTDDSFENVITVIDPKSPQFPLGQETRINMRFEPQDASNMWFQAGVRV